MNTTGGGGFNPAPSATSDTYATIKANREAKVQASLPVVPVPKKTRKEKFDEGTADTTADLKGIGTGIAEDFKKRQAQADATKLAYKSGDQGLLRTGFQAVGQSAGLVADSIGQILKGVVKAVLPQSAETAIKNKAGEVVKGALELPFKEGGDANLSNTVVAPLMAKYEELKKTNPKLARDIDATLGIADLASMFVGGEAVKPVASGVKEGAEQFVKTGAKEAVVDAIDQGARVATKVGQAKNAVKNAIAPEITADKALGEIFLASKPKDIASAKKAVESLDLSNLSGREDLMTALKKNVKTNADIVTEDLKKGSMDEYGRTIANTLDELATRETSKGGQEIVTNHVENALKQLSELYDKTGNAVEKANTDELLAHAQVNGLTKDEVNNIAKVYGSEFKTKAFSKTGEPLTSINAQAYENTRKGVKEVARKGLSTDVARQADATISATYDAIDRLEKVINATTAAKNKVRAKGFIPRNVAKLYDIADAFSFGSISSIISKFKSESGDVTKLDLVKLDELAKDNLKTLNKVNQAKNKAEADAIIEKDLTEFFKKAREAGISPDDLD